MYDNEKELQWSKSEVSETKILTLSLGAIKIS